MFILCTIAWGGGELEYVRQPSRFLTYLAVVRMQPGLTVANWQVAVFAKSSRPSTAPYHLEIIHSSSVRIIFSCVTLFFYYHT